MKFTHVNIVSDNWKELADFYIKVFECRPKPPERNLSGNWVDDLTNLNDIQIHGMHLLLPGYDSNGPTLEIFQFSSSIKNSNKKINLQGFAHIAFAVDNVEEALQKLIDNGGSTAGELIETEIKGVGRLTAIYAKDPEGNIIEIQKWN